jgi:hypothetical protein
MCSEMIFAVNHKKLLNNKLSILNYILKVILKLILALITLVIKSIKVHCISKSRGIHISLF